MPSLAHSFLLRPSFFRARIVRVHSEASARATSCSEINTHVLEPITSIIRSIYITQHPTHTHATSHATLRRRPQCSRACWCCIARTYNVFILWVMSFVRDRRAQICWVLCVWIACARLVCMEYVHMESEHLNASLRLCCTRAHTECRR